MHWPRVAIEAKKADALSFTFSMVDPLGWCILRGTRDACRGAIFWFVERALKQFLDAFHADGGLVREGGRCARSAGSAPEFDGVGETLDESVRLRLC